LNPAYILPSRSTVTRLFDEEFEERIDKLHSLCKSAKYPSYTADLWKSIAGDYYCSIGFHFIDDNWILHAIVTHCKHVIGSHTAKNIGRLVGECLQECLGKGISPFAGVTDGGEIASVNETAQFLECEIQDRTCICHQLNNIIKKMLSDYFEETFLCS